MQIAENTVVAFHYTLTNEAGQTIDSCLLYTSDAADE